MDHVEKLISDVKLSSVVPGRITGDDKLQHEFTNMDLIMKLHYIKALYFFKNEVVEGLHIHDLKLPMFNLLELYYPISGRIRRNDGGDGGGGGGRPFMKCNDSGVRVVEAKCKNKTIDEWLAMNDSDHDELVYDQLLGPDLGFSPLVFIQFTWFKCGGMSIGLSWAHILGDSFSASNFLNIWAKIMVGQQISPQFLQKSTKTNKLINNNNNNNPILSTTRKFPFSLKRVDPVGDHWKITNNIKMQSHSLHITQKQLNQLLSKVCGTYYKVKPFDVICATLWKMLAKVRGEYSSEPAIVTIIRGDHDNETTEVVSSNNQVTISTVEANDVKVSDVDTSKLTELIGEKTVDETRIVEELMEKENGVSDFIVYGANLTFVNLEEAMIYDLELRGKKPIFASYNISGVGDEGVILVLPRLEGGRIVNLVLPQKQIEGLKNKMRVELGIF
ncbi:protein ECERIFERUM 2 [Solanum pennellii]|uniref:Protein ECERIFERUM 2 n=1 Tax=Solanum pennellii TaxID=28526 RepID=A0ABM1FQD1_SOLPN|nr:protein ECERIFERUM 2 [Solanum pennellii]